MAKISPTSIKYIIHAKFEAQGAIEKPDIIGAIFGQTEGLLGEDLEMRELQKNGKIGRIEVSSASKNSKTVGEIEIPSAMGKTETSLIAASIETIERIGPSDTKVSVEEIEDVRGSKRDFILDRAKALMEKLGESGEKIEEMTNEVNESTKLSKIQKYGTENVPCGDISDDEIIIVEGRADVVNLIKKDFKNVIAMNGTRLPKSVTELTERKSRVILFVDGDRGGNLIIKNVIDNAKIDYIAMAPEGKEVEELTGKEIHQALRKKVKASEFKENKRGRGVKKYKKSYSKKSSKGSSKKKPNEIKKMTDEEKDKIKDKIKDLIGTKGAIIFNKELEKIKKSPKFKLGSIRLDEEPYIIAIDGTATPKVIENCENLGCHNLIATNFVEADTNLNLVSV